MVLLPAIALGDDSLLLYCRISNIKYEYAKVPNWPDCLLTILHSAQNLTTRPPYVRTFCTLRTSIVACALGIVVVDVIWWLLRLVLVQGGTVYILGQ